MIFMKILWSVYIISFGYSVLCNEDDDKIVKEQNVGRSTRQRYKFNHPPAAENYQAIPVAVVYDEGGSRGFKSLEPTVSTKTEISSVKVSSPKTITTKSAVPYDDNDIEVKIDRHNKNSNQQEMRLNRHFETMQQIPVVVVYDDPNAAPNTKRSSINNPARERIRGFILRKLNDENKPSQSETKVIRNTVLNKDQPHTVTTKTQKENGNRTTLNTEATSLNITDSIKPNEESVEAGKIYLPELSEISKFNQMMDVQKENSNTKPSNSDIETTNKMVERKSNKDTATTKPQIIENQKEHGNRTSPKIGTNDILNSGIKKDQMESHVAHKTDEEKYNSPNRDKGSASIKLDQTLETQKDTNVNKSLKADVESTRKIVDDKVNVATSKPDITNVQKENGNRTSPNSRTINVSNNRRRTERKDEIKLTQTENSNLQTSKAADAANVPKFAKRTRGRDPVVPIIESENRVYSHNGGFKYSYEGGDGTKAFEKGELKTFDDEKTGEAVVGGYSYKDKDGNDFSLSYTADENGYRPVGAHLPTPPPIPPAIARALLYLATKPTPEPDTESFTKSYKDY